MASEVDSVKEIRRNESAIVVVLSGQIDLHHTPAVHHAFIDVCEEKPERLIINLGEVDYMDSSGVGALVEVFRRVNAYGGKLSLCCMNERVHSIFEITKLDQFFKIYATEEEALAG
ncbi:MAG: STAS domain-containing protein [Planctomycetota bacterium]|nr:MAG: STAS domain-containing protein [Planctomycetota bacterium]